MNMPEPDSRLEAWERWESPAISALPYVMLTITVIVTFLVFTGSDGSLLIDMGVVGLAAGLLCSVATLSVMGKLLFEVKAWDVQTLLGVSVVLGVAALAASYVPAHRAASVHPVEALRAE